MYMCFVFPMWKLQCNFLQHVDYSERSMMHAGIHGSPQAFTCRFHGQGIVHWYWKHALNVPLGCIWCILPVSVTYNLAPDCMNHPVEKSGLQQSLDKYFLMFNTVSIFSEGWSNLFIGSLNSQNKDIRKLRKSSFMLISKVVFIFSSHISNENIKVVKNVWCLQTFVLCCRLQFLNRILFF